MQSRKGSYKSTSYNGGRRKAGVYAGHKAARTAAFTANRKSFAPTSSAPVVNPETKYFDCGIQQFVSWNGTDWSNSEVACDNYVNSSGTAAAYTDSALIPSAIGSGYGQVNGNRYKLKKIRVRGEIGVQVETDDVDALQPTTYRLMLVMDTQPNGSQAQGEDIMQDIGAAGENLYSFKRVASSSGRFRILKDVFGVLEPNNSQTDGANTGSIGSATHQFSFQYQPNQPILVNVKSGNATPTVAGLETCNIFMLLVGNRATTAGTPAAEAMYIRAASRAYYVD